MKQTVLITGGQLVLPDRVVAGGELFIEDGVVVYAGRQSDHRGRPADRVIDAQGGYILPGFIDMHSDAIEKELEPRPGAFFNTEVAFSELEKKLAGQGISTMYHSFSFAGAEWGVREDNGAANCIRQIVDIASSYALIRNKIHLRFEVTNYKAVDVIRGLLRDGVIDLLSFMDHTPGQGQYPTVQDYQRYVEKTYHVHFSEVEKILAAKDEGRTRIDESVALLQAAALTEAVPLASHDDDSPERVGYFHSKGITMSEFPINVATAQAARGLGMDVCVGAPNIVRGGSTGKGMRAIDAIEAGAVNILCSDYYPPAILHAVFQLARQTLSLPEAVAMATSAPARALGLTTLGSLAEGSTADAIVVKIRGEVPVVTNTVVGGIPVYDVNYRTVDYAGRMMLKQPAC
ncbi:MAG: alpha-D-ribose 1-methylphosphonate 5-triphosphate diphosphatase [Negativicutes bacterium]|nr:alpha-D-ribose 1-methylphosphonate 5-triphosphate diphosphatase [Negativicutes bacterium]